MAPIFINYRRIDSSGSAGRLYDRLVRAFGADSVFMDIDGIAPGQVFDQVLNNNLEDCVIFLAVIGRYWSDELQKRLGDPEDFVRKEIEIALSRDGEIIVIPVLVDDVDFTKLGPLPSSIVALQRRNAWPLRHHRYNDDVNNLIEQIDQWKVAAILPSNAELLLVNSVVNFPGWRSDILIARVGEKNVLYEGDTQRADLTEPDETYFIPRPDSKKVYALLAGQSGTIVVPAGYHRLTFIIRTEIKTEALKNRLGLLEPYITFNVVKMLPLEAGQKLELIFTITGIQAPSGVNINPLLLSARYTN